LKGNSDIAIGNVLGSNLSNIGLVLGVTGLFYPILIRQSHVRFDFLLTVLAAILFYGFSYNGIISLREGIILFSLFLGFNAYLFRKLGSGIGDTLEDAETEVEQAKNFTWKVAIGLFFGGILGLYIGSELLVVNAVKISGELGVSERIIGITIVAIGTSLPELVTSIIAALSKRTDLALGNILGSNILNILAVIGITAIIKPIRVSQEFIDSDYLWMIGITLLLYPLMKTKMRISMIEGAILLTCYISYLFFLL
jgi:cation:H+ antiporter